MLNNIINDNKHEIINDIMKVLWYEWYLDWLLSWVSSWHFELKLRLSWIAHIFNLIQVELLIFSTQRDST